MTIKYTEPTEDLATSTTLTDFTFAGLRGWTKPEGSPESIAAAEALSASSNRRVDAPIRKAFVRAAAEDAGVEGTPMSRIYAGGRSGVVALKLYLALLLKCSSPPYSTEMTYPSLAILLDLDDPGKNGIRRIAHAVRTLQQMNLLSVRRQPGKPNVLKLLDEHGDGTRYELPSSAYSQAQHNKQPPAERDRHLYFKFPTRLWILGRVQHMSGAALVMLLILLAEQAGDGKEIWFSTNNFPARYAISHTTRAAGTRELISRGILSVESRSLTAWVTKGAIFDPKRRRKVYSLTWQALTSAD